MPPYSLPSYTDGPRRPPRVSTSLKKALTGLSSSRLKTIAPPKYNDRYGSSRTSTGAKALKAVAARPVAVSSGGGGSSGGGSYNSNRSGYSYRAPSYRSYGGGSGGSGGGGGGGGGVPLPVAWNPTGAAANYLESAADLFAKDPTIMLKDLVNQKFAGEDGLGDGQIYARLAPTIRNANPLFMAAQGQAGATGTNESWINWLDAFINQQLTPGSYFDSAGAIGNVLNASSGSPLEAYLTQGDGTEQAGNTRNLLEAALDTGYHPMMAEAISKSLQEQQQNYLAATARAAQDPFVSYLKATNPNLQRLLGVPV